MQKKGQSLYEQLQEYGKKEYVAFHMPGHKRQVRPDALPKGLPWEIDITEIDGFDDLHHAEGILKESMDFAAAFYGVKKTLYSINGSTAGILSAVFAAVKPGETILMGRNCHKSVYHAVMLRGLRPLYLYPRIEEETGLDCGYVAAELENMLTEHREIRAVIVTSPTYEGVIADIQTMAAMIHCFGIPLIVDEAHGAHLSVRGRKGGGAPAFPLSAVSLGADLVIQSVHKTLPSLTQTALLHVCEGAADALAEDVTRYMSIFQTSSPSYVLLASTDACLRFMASGKGQRQRNEYTLLLAEWRNKWKKFRHIRLLEPGTGNAPENTWQDASKLVFSAAGCTGRELYDWLQREYHLQPEMCTPTYVLLMTSLLDTDEMYRRLDQALCEIDQRIDADQSSRHTETDTDADDACGLPGASERQNDERRFARPYPSVYVLSPAEADKRPQKEMLLWESGGLVSAEYVYLYPPGSPLLVPGEEIRAETLDYLKKAGEMGIKVKGLRDISGEKIHVLDFANERVD